MKMNYFANFQNILITLFIVFSAFVCHAVVHHSLEEARLERQRLVQKYIKTLNKEEGAVRLVGGDVDYEGELVKTEKKVQFGNGNGIR